MLFKPLKMIQNVLISKSVKPRFYAFYCHSSRNKSNKKWVLISVYIKKQLQLMLSFDDSGNVISYKKNLG